MTLRVLIADDAPEIRAVLRLVFETASYEVVEAADGVEAVAVAAQTRPDVALLDVAMPRKDGIETVAELREVSPGTRVVVLSAFSESRHGPRAIEAGADVYLEKRASHRDLLDVVTSLTGAAPAAAQHPPVREPGGEAPALRPDAEYHAVLDALEEGVLIVGVDGVVRTATFQAAAALGLPTSAVVGRPLDELCRVTAVDGVTAPTHALLDAVAAARPRSGLMIVGVRSDGGDVRLLANIRPLAPAVGAPPEAVVLTVLDVTAAHPSDRPRVPVRGITERVELLEAAIASCPDGFLVLDPDGFAVIVNARADALLGGSGLLESRRPIAMPPAAVRDLAEGRIEPDLLRRVAAGEVLANVELLVHSRAYPDGIHVLLDGHPLIDADGQPVGVVVSVHNDTARHEARREADEYRAELERSNAELDQFAATVAHDLAQPLVTVSAAVALARHRLTGQVDEETDRLLRFVGDGVIRLHELVQGIHAFAQVTREPPPRERVDLNDTAAAVVALLGDRMTNTGAEVTVGRLPTVEGDRTQLARLLQNLVVNALTHARSDVVPKVAVSAIPVDDEWRIEVVDNGLGIPESERERIFDMFRRGSSGGASAGSGIGLAVCRRIVERHGGRIWVEDAPGGGSRFCFTIPA